jgi:hypothetical protein
MKKTSGWTTGILGSVLILITISVPKQARANIILPASNNATVQPGGPRAGVNGKQFFNMEGSANGTFASFGVVDFQPSPMSLQVTSLTVTLTQANAAFTHNGALTFYLSTDTATNIEPGVSPLIYNPADIPTGLGTQLSPIFPLGTGSFTQVSDGTMDIFSFSFSPSAAVASYLTSQISTGGRIRVVIAPGDPTVAATYAGFSNTEFAGPELTLAAPEPGTLGGASLALLALTVGLGSARGLRLRAAQLARCRVGDTGADCDGQRGSSIFDPYILGFQSKGGTHMKKLGSIVALIAAFLPGAQAGTITAWTFENNTIAVNNNPAPSTGLGTASSIGMNVYPTPNVGVTTDDVLAGTAGDTGVNGVANTTQIWRVRAQAGSNGAANGWSSLAPIGTQGAVFDASTVGYNAINVSFDWYATNQGEAKLQLAYTTDGSTWHNVPLMLSTSDAGLAVLNNSTSPNTVNGSYVSITGGTGQDWFTGLTAIINDPNAANNPNFGIEMVNAATGADNISASGTPLNNNSGNWRFDNVTISGTALVSSVPEPATFALFGIGVVVLLAGRGKFALGRSTDISVIGRTTSIQSRSRDL